jgi:hypothetical protein
MSVIKKFRGIEFWAENGVIYLSNEARAAGKDYDSLPVEEQLKIFKGLPPKVFLRRVISAAARLEYESPKEALKLLEDGYEVFRTAKKQGAFDDPKADEYKVKHKVFSKPSIIVPDTVINNFANEVRSKTPEQILVEGLSNENNP